MGLRAEALSFLEKSVLYSEPDFKLPDKVKEDLRALISADYINQKNAEELYMARGFKPEWMPRDYFVLMAENLRSKYEKQIKEIEQNIASSTRLMDEFNYVMLDIGRIKAKAAYAEISEISAEVDALETKVHSSVTELQKKNVQARLQLAAMTDTSGFIEQCQELIDRYYEQERNRNPEARLDILDGERSAGKA